VKALEVTGIFDRSKKELDLSRDSPQGNGRGSADSTSIFACRNRTLP